MTFQILEAGVDYITVTAKTDADRIGLSRVGRQVMVSAIASGARYMPWTWCGYIGQRAGSIALGERPDTTILRIAGPKADSTCPLLAPLRLHASRVDLQCTVRLADLPPDWITHQWGLVQAASSSRGAALSSSLVQSSDGGATLYIGSRQSDMFGRLYNKAVESGEQRYRGCWRYEVEVKGDHAAAMFPHIAGAADRGRVAIAGVFDWYAARGITMPVHMPEATQIPLPLPHRTDVATTMAWLGKQVAPAVSRLSDLGHADAIRCLLALEKEHGSQEPTSCGQKPDDRTDSRHPV